MLLKKWIYSLPFVVTQLFAVGYAHADIAYVPGGNSSGYINGGANYAVQGSYGLAGSGYWGGAQACPYRVKTSKAATSESDDIKEEKKKVEKLKGEVALAKVKQKRSEDKLEFLAKKINRFFTLLRNMRI